MKRILFIVNGQGLGNSTRCHSIIQHLSRMGNEIEILTAGSGISYFKSVSEVKKTHTQLQLTYKGAGGRINYLRTFLSFPLYISDLMKNMNTLSDLLKNGNFDAVVIDSDYTIMALKRHPPLVAINNSQMVMEMMRQEGFRSLFSIPAMMERLDFLFHRIFPDLVLSLAFKPPETGLNKFRHVPLIARENSAKKAVSDKSPSSVLVIPGGSPFSEMNSILENLTLPPGTRKITVPKGAHVKGDIEIVSYSRTDNIPDLINSHDLLIIQGGLSSISESVMFKKPAVIIPLENHPEQMANARAYEELGLGVRSTRQTLSKDLVRLIESWPQFVKSHQNYSEPNGAKVAAKLINELASAK